MALPGKNCFCPELFSYSENTAFSGQKRLFRFMLYIDRMINLRGEIIKESKIVRKKENTLLAKKATKKTIKKKISQF